MDVRTFLIATLAIRTVLVLLGFAVFVLFLIRSYRNGPVTNALVFYFFASVFAQGYYVLANYETWFYQSAYMQTFGIIVWIPMLLATVLLFIVLLQGRPARPTP